MNYLQNYSWSGTSDTETLLKCFDFYGIENSIKKLIGMFSIAVYDKKQWITHKR